MKINYGIITLLLFLTACTKEHKQTNICVTVNQDNAINCQDALCAPILLEPENCSIFDFYPREVNYRWTSNSTQDSIEYELDARWSWHNTDNFGEWDEASSDGSSRIVQDTFFTGGFAGAQPGRWRVRAISNQDTSEWSAWHYFKFLR